MYFEFFEKFESAPTVHYRCVVKVRNLSFAGRNFDPTFDVNVPLKDLDFDTLKSMSTSFDSI